ncbi:MAG TPA: class I SAM-dependent methyltransferase [Kribbellaceae bacterium]|nr:class I SAM-dependent methyltransferase [Kribbellaceae bacterium]
MLITSRSYAEYRAMFDLPDPLPASVLDCCAGGSGFTAVAAAQGVDAVAADPAYTMSVGELAEAVHGGSSRGAGIVDQYPGDFVWTWYGTRENRERMRAAAAEEFLADRVRCPERYVAASLPDLPFEPGRFALALCSHLLFTWSDQLDDRWHLDALRELCRVAAEVRVFPLVVQGNGAPVPFLDDVRRALAGEGIESEVRKVPYEFQRDADEMLLIAGTAC